MNKSKLKPYAPQACKDFIAAVTARANLLGLSEAGDKLEVAPVKEKATSPSLPVVNGRLKYRGDGVSESKHQT